MLYIMALALAPRGVFENKKFFRPITNGLMERSLRYSNDLITGIGLNRCAVVKDF
jgi:hypothetical protein